MNFEFLLFIGTLITGIIWLFIQFTPNKRHHSKLLQELSSCFPILLLVFGIRSFLYEPFRIPSGSMKPVLTEGDFILIDKFSHGIRWPILHKRISDRKPNRGDIVVFKGDVHGQEAYVIKRIIGLPGDHIVYKDKELYINGTHIEKKFLGAEKDEDITSGSEYPVLKYEEKLSATKSYNIYNYPFISRDSYPYDNVTVPPNHYFVLGNNRDNSNDGRFLGFLPDNKIIGRARMIWFSLKNYRIRWDRIGPVT